MNEIHRDGICARRQLKGFLNGAARVAVLTADGPEGAALSDFAAAPAIEIRSTFKFLFIYRTGHCHSNEFIKAHSSQIVTLVNGYQSRLHLQTFLELKNVGLSLDLVA